MNQSNDSIESSGEHEITGEMLEILKIVTFEDRGVEAEYLANKLGISTPKAEYYLDELTERNFVHSGVTFGESALYLVTKEGRKYMFDKGLL